MVSNTKVLFVAVVLGLIAVSNCQKDEKKEEVVAATLATPTALFKCGEVRIQFFLYMSSFVCRFYRLTAEM